MLTFNYKVNLELSSNISKPGKNVTMKVFSLKYSTVTIFGLDIGELCLTYERDFFLILWNLASKLLRSGNGFEKSDVIENLNNYNPPNWDIYNLPADVQDFGVRKVQIFWKKWPDRLLID